MIAVAMGSPPSLPSLSLDDAENAGECNAQCVSASINDLPMDILRHHFPMDQIGQLCCTGHHFHREFQIMLMAEGWRRFEVGLRSTCGIHLNMEQVLGREYADSVNDFSEICMDFIIRSCPVFPEVNFANASVILELREIGVYGAGHTEDILLKRLEMLRVCRGSDVDLHFFIPLNDETSAIFSALEPLSSMGAVSRIDMFVKDDALNSFILTRFSGVLTRLTIYLEGPTLLSNLESFIMATPQLQSITIKTPKDLSVQQNLNIARSLATLTQLHTLRWSSTFKIRIDESEFNIFLPEAFDSPVLNSVIFELISAIELQPSIAHFTMDTVDVGLLRHSIHKVEICNLENVQLNIYSEQQLDLAFAVTSKHLVAEHFALLIDYDISNDIRALWDWCYPIVKSVRSFEIHFDCGKLSHSSMLEEAYDKNVRAKQEFDWFLRHYQQYIRSYNENTFTLALN